VQEVRAEKSWFRHRVDFRAPPAAYPHDRRAIYRASAFHDAARPADASYAEPDSTRTSDTRSVAILRAMHSESAYLRYAKEALPRERSSAMRHRPCLPRDRC